MPPPHPAILRLPNEILHTILHPQDALSPAQSRQQVSRLRLTCRRFRAISSPWLMQKTTVDMTRPETLSRFQALSRDAAIASGVREVYLRLHFHHPWMAESIDNFASAIYSEWDDRADAWTTTTTTTREAGDPNPKSLLQCIRDFMRKLDPGRCDGVKVARELVQGAEETCPRPVAVDASRLDTATKEILREAYALYKARFAAQDEMLRDGNFIRVFAESFAALPERVYGTRCFTLFDRDLASEAEDYTWEDTLFRADDTKEQKKALVSALSRPMLWEDARWSGTRDDVWHHVPVAMLLDVIVEMGKHKSIILNNIVISVSSAPDYEFLPTDPARLQQLTAAIRSMDLVQFRFNPRTLRRTARRPHTASRLAVRSTEEVSAINRYLGAIVASGVLASYEVILSDFWDSAALRDAESSPGPLGASFDWPLGTEFYSVVIEAAPMTMDDFVGLAKALPEDAEMHMSTIHLREGSWRDVLDTFRAHCKRLRMVTITDVKGGGIDDGARRYAFGSDDWGPSRAARYMMGEDISNPLTSERDE